MKIFSWMHNKLTGKQDIKKENLVATNKIHTREDSREEEFNDWPQGLLAIGTFGNNDNLQQKPDKSHINGAHSTSEINLQDIAPEEVNEIQKVITSILDRRQGEGLLETVNPQNVCVDDERNNEEPSTSVVLNREKDTHADQRKGSIRKKSLSFILKKMLVCRSGFSLTHGLKYPIVDKSRMEKILRAILHKKIYPQNANPKATAKKYLETNQLSCSDSDDNMFDAENDGSKWVKTDSDCSSWEKMRVLRLHLVEGDIYKDLSIPKKIRFFEHAHRAACDQMYQKFLCFLNQGQDIGIIEP